MTSSVKKLHAVTTELHKKNPRKTSMAPSIPPRTDGSNEGTSSPLGKCQLLTENHYHQHQPPQPLAGTLLPPFSGCHRPTIWDLAHGAHPCHLCAGRLKIFPAQTQFGCFLKRKRSEARIFKNSPPRATQTVNRYRNSALQSPAGAS